MSDGSGNNTIVLGDGPLGPNATADRDVMVTMSDGVRIACDVFRPKAPGKYPVLYAVAPYMKDAVHLSTMKVARYRETGHIAKWVDQGYVYVHADARGSGKSDGLYVPFCKEELRDLYEMIEWCAAQPWSSGKVGMFGESYYSMVQWAAAAQNPPHLTCCAPYDACADLYRQFCFKGGILYIGFQNHWYPNGVRNRAYLCYPERPQREDYMSHDFLFDLMRHPTFDEYWKPLRFDLSAIKVPIFSIGNWRSTVTHLLGNLQGFMQAGGPRKLLVNSGDSQELFLDPEIEAQLQRWFDYWLKGIDNGVMDEPLVRIYVRNGEGYRDEQEWPLKRAKSRNLYLAPGPSGAVESLNDGKLSWDEPARGVKPTSYTYPDPAWSFPGIGSSVLGKAGMPHTTRKIVTFTSEPVSQEFEVTGPIALNLWASSSANDTQFLVKILDQPPPTPEMTAAIKTLDVAPPAQMVTEGWLRATHRALDPARSTPLSPYHTHEHPEPLEPGRIYPFQIEIWPTCWVFKPGHRIRLEITALDQRADFFLGHLRATDSFYHDAEHPSHLVLPVVS